jgi:hypothetical protein
MKFVKEKAMEVTKQNEETREKSKPEEHDDFISTDKLPTQSPPFRTGTQMRKG